MARLFKQAPSGTRCRRGIYRRYVALTLRTEQATAALLLAWSKENEVLATLEHARATWAKPIAGVASPSVKTAAVEYAIVIQETRKLGDAGRYQVLMYYLGKCHNPITKFFLSSVLVNDFGEKSQWAVLEAIRDTTVADKKESAKWDTAVARSLMVRNLLHVCNDEVAKNLLALDVSFGTRIPQVLRPVLTAMLVPSGKEISAETVEQRLEEKASR